MANESKPTMSRRSRTANDKQKPARSEKKPPRSGKTGKKRSKKSIFLKIFLGLLIAGCVAFLSGVALFWYYAKDAPEITDAKLEAAQSSKIYDGSGNLLIDLGAEKRETISASDVPQLLVDAVVSVEDKRFYSHIGVDPVRIIGSLVSNVKTGGLQGGSTLTQQLIKLSYFSTNASDQTLKRKAQEAWMAIQLEKKKSKQEILTYYINKVYMSNGFYGMETAAQSFYGKSLSELNLPQTALLAGMPQAPNSYDPYVHPETAKKRRDTVLYTMLENKKISQAEYEAAVATDIKDGLQELSNSNSERKIYDNYLKEVIAQVEDKTGKDIYTDGLDVYTNLDLDAQKQLYTIVNTSDYIEYPDDDLQVAATLVDADTGAVKAQIGGRKIADDVYLGNNLAVNTSRDFGSTVKPITDYGPAIEYLEKSTGQTIVDEPYNYEGTDIPVRNWDRQYMGSISLRTALAESRNIPAVKLFNEVGADKVAEFLGGLGIQYKSIEQSNAISSNTATQDGTKYGISSEKMAAAYAAFANGGTYHEPLYINKIVYQDGSEESFSAEGTKAMEDYTAYMITDMLKTTVESGTGTNAQIAGLYQAGKTGTSNYSDEEAEKLNLSGSFSPDVMFTGYTPSYSLSVWTGYNNRMTPITSASNKIASDVYRELMQYVSAKVENTDWTMPDSVYRSGNELYVKGSSEASSSTFEASSTIPESSTTETSTTASSEAVSSETSETSSTESSEPEPSVSSTEPSIPESSSSTPDTAASESSTTETASSTESASAESESLPEQP